MNTPRKELLKIIETHFRRMILSVIVAMLSCVVAHAQSSFEVHVDGGGTFYLPGARAVSFIQGCGIPCTPSTITFASADSGERPLQPSIGGGFSITFWKKILGGYADYSYVLGDTRSASTFLSSASASATDHTSYSIVQAGLQVSVPTVYKVVPYFQVGSGFVHLSDTLVFTASGTVINPGTFPSNNSRYIPLLGHFGGGVRYMLWRDRFGIRAGVDGYYLRSGINEPTPVPIVNGAPAPNPGALRHGFGRVTVGFFWQR